MQIIVSMKTDRGWAWIVLIATFLDTLLIFGVTFSTGIYYVSWTKSFKKSKSLIALVASTNSGLLFMIGPIASIITSFLGIRRTIIVTSAIAAVGCVLASFATSVVQLILTYGILTGGALGVSYAAGFAIIGEYFDKWRPIAFGIAASGVGAGSLIFAPLLECLVMYYGWRGAMLVTGGILFHGCAIGALMKQAPHMDEKRKYMSVIHHLKVSFDFHLFCDRTFALLSLGTFLWGLANSPVLILLPEYIVTQGWSTEDAAKLLGMFGIANIVGRPLAGLINQAKLLNLCSVHLFYLGSILSGCFAVAIGIAELEFIHYAIFVCFYGLFFGFIFGVWGATLADLFGKEKLLGAVGWQFVWTGLSFTAGAPLGSIMIESTHSFSSAFYMAGTLTIISGLVITFIPMCRNRTAGQRQQADIAEKATYIPVRVKDILENSKVL